MELKMHWHIIKGGKRLVLATALVCVCIAALVNVFGYTGIAGTFNLYLIPYVQTGAAGEEAASAAPVSSGKPALTSETIDEFSIDLDQFYRLRAAELQARMIRQWLYDPAVRRDIAKPVGDATTSVVTAATIDSLKIDQIGSQLVRVHFRAAREAEVMPLMTAITTELNNRLGVIQGRHDQFSSFRVQGFDLDVGPREAPTGINFAIAVVLGVGLGALFVLFRHYWTSTDASPPLHKP
nr:hypothetical protein [uncultured archaeon]